MLERVNLGDFLGNYIIKPVRQLILLVSRVLQEPVVSATEPRKNIITHTQQVTQRLLSKFVSKASQCLSAAKGPARRAGSRAESKVGRQTLQNRHQ
jgi:hypothetical protein